MRRIPDYAYLVLDRIKLSGNEAYIVGGAVRDLYLNRPIKDIDINTNLLPEEIKELFSDYEISTRGEKHGTITIIVGHRYNRVEVTTYRIDGEYTDSRHPDYIDFNADLITDLSRRDFTMNSLCYDGYDTYIDEFNARKDIDNKIIRVIGDGNERFEEDAIRIMRGFRFVAQLGFKLDDKTKQAMTNCKDKLYEISPERVSFEFFKLINEEHSAMAIQSILDCGVFEGQITNFTKEELVIYSKAESLHLKLFLLFRHTYMNEDNIIKIGKKRASVLKWLEDNIKVYENGLPVNRNDLKNIIHTHGAKNVRRLGEYLVINNKQSELILTIIEDVRYNWSRYGSGTGSSNYNIVNINQYIEYNNEELAITKEKLLEKTTVTPEHVDVVYDYLFECVKCKNFINEQKELIKRADKKMEKIKIALAISESNN